MDQRESNKELIELIKQDIDTQENYEKLYTQNRGFIYQVIKRRVHGIYEYDDLMQQAFIALVKAVECYDTTRPPEESNFLQILKFCIWNEIRDTDIPAHMVQKIINYKKTYSRLCDELDRKPKTSEMMLELNISMNELETIRAAMQRPLSLNEPVGEEGNTTRMDLYADSRADENINFDEDLQQQDLKRIVHEALEKLPDADQVIINKRYFQNITLEQLAQERNVTRERIRQIETKALWKLRRDHKFKTKVIYYTGLNEYKSVGSRQFNTTKTSSVEWLVLEREKINSREQEISLWLK